MTSNAARAAWQGTLAEGASSDHRYPWHAPEKQQGLPQRFRISSWVVFGGNAPRRVLGVFVDPSQPGRVRYRIEGCDGYVSEDAMSVAQAPT